MIKVATVCTGIGSPEQAIKELGIPHEITFACEIDKYARKSYLANFKPNQMYTDMTKENWDLPEQYSDFFFGGIPCQAFSLAGKRLGELDPRGLLFFDYYRYVKNQQPKVFGIENVKGLLNDNSGKTFSNWLLLLGDTVNGHRQMFSHPDCLGYNIYWQVLNTKDYGLPQNRERVFIIGIRKDVDDGSFRFPKGWKLEKRLKDVLESEVDEKYYLSDKLLSFFKSHEEKQKAKGNGFAFKPKSKEDVATTITARYAKNGLDDNYIKEDPICVAMRGRNPEKPSDRTTGAPTQQRLESNSQGTTNTITSVQKDNLIVEPSILQTNLSGETFENDYAGTLRAGASSNYQLVKTNRIRRLTPLETWRLQGFPDEAFYNAKNDGLSDSQLYKQAGNSISVPVIKEIIKNLIPILCR